MFYDQRRIDNFCPQNDLLPEKTENTLKSGTDYLLVFQQLKIKSAP